MKQIIRKARLNISKDKSKIRNIKIKLKINEEINAIDSQQTNERGYNLSKPKKGD